eukprot:TRINITY_DN12798_c0_g1_i1.p1 TRINITY_DN12798_c0_g1~~TRINITY_DN12798_c0_g1_i1.p1  ORF type:complete len:541 (+),score=102.48 TRINITY_DN12798_c0_g1_i1:88-1623(+)
MRVVAPLAVGLALASPADAKPHRMSMMDNPPLPPVLLDAAAPDAASKLPKPQFVQMKLDHFNESDTQTWKQAYYVNDTFWVPGSDAPVFLCVGGEGPFLDGSAVVRSAHCNIAVEWLSEMKALMFALEHRYYGCHIPEGCPVNDPSDLRYLSSRQAVEDVAEFVRQQNKNYKLDSKNRWITWGGSYPGMLAGFSRLKHPELIHAAVASSAPVHAKLNMKEYQDWVSQAYAVEDNGVGGSPACRDAIRAGHKVLEDLLRGGQVARIETLLGLRKGELATKEMQAEILGNGIASFPSQGNDPACDQPGCNIARICKIMLDTSLGNELDRLLALRQKQLSQDLAAPVASRASAKSPGDSKAELPDFWFYQTCTEFGFYQTCEDNSSCLYVRGLVDLASFMDECKQWNITADQIAASIEATNKHYGGLRPTDEKGQLGSRVLWPNGEVDPWASLSVLSSPGPAQPTLWVPGASHHAWTHPSSAFDQASVIGARDKIRKQVRAFLAEAADPERILV